MASLGGGVPGRVRGISAVVLTGEPMCRMAERRPAVQIFIITTSLSFQTETGAGHRLLSPVQHS